MSDDPSSLAELAGMPPVRSEDSAGGATTRRSAEWIATSYRNQREPGVFAPVGPLE